MVLALSVELLCFCTGSSGFRLGSQLGVVTSDVERWCASNPNEECGEPRSNSAAN